MVQSAAFDSARFEANAGRAARLLRALANERRLMILCRLAEGEKSVGQLLPLAGLSQSALSQHLAVLRAEGIVDTRREARSVWYRIADPAALAVTETLADVICSRSPKGSA